MPLGSRRRQRFGLKGRYQLILLYATATSVLGCVMAMTFQITTGSFRAPPPCQRLVLQHAR